MERTMAKMNMAMRISIRVKPKQFSPQRHRERRVNFRFAPSGDHDRAKKQTPLLPLCRRGEHNSEQILPKFPLLRFWKCIPLLGFGHKPVQPETVFVLVDLFPGNRQINLFEVVRDAFGFIKCNIVYVQVPTIARKILAEIT